MSLQYLIVIAIIVLAVVFSVNAMWRKRKAFSTKNACGKSDCGCGK